VYLRNENSIGEERLLQHYDTKQLDYMLVICFHVRQLFIIYKYWFSSSMSLLC